jgi:hypothetical protein
VAWEVEYTDPFESWWNDLDEDVQFAISKKVVLLAEIGPALSRPHSDTVHGSKHPNMKELRVPTKGVFRIFYAFDPRRAAILLIGGNKEGKDEKLFYQEMIAEADQIFDSHLQEIEDEENQEIF